METKFKKKYQITTNMFDKNDTIRVSSLLDIAQEIAGQHAEELGCGFQAMLDQNLIWVVVRNYIEIYKTPKNFFEIEAVTYPLKPRFVEFNRDTEFYHNGELFAALRSTWMVINIKDYKLESPHFFDHLTDKDGFFKRRISKLPARKKDELQKVKDVEVVYSMIDHNGHLNNTHYSDFYLDIYKPLNPIKTMQIEYIKQCFLDEDISLYKLEEDANRYLYGYKDDELRFYMECKENKDYEN